MDNRQYLIGIKDGVSPCGNNGTTITHYKARYKIMEVSRKFKRMFNHDEIYLIRHYPQKACELTGDAFVAWVKTTGERLL